MAVSNTQLQAHKLMQEFAFSRPGLLPGVLAPPGGALLPLAAHAGPGPNEQLALVPVMIQNPDGSFTGAYQVQPYPSGFSTDGVLPELPGALPPILWFSHRIRFVMSHATCWPSDSRSSLRSVASRGCSLAKAWH